MSVSGNSVELGHGPVIQTAPDHFFTYISLRTWAMAAEIKLTMCVPVVRTAPSGYGAMRILSLSRQQARPIERSTQLILRSGFHWMYPLGPPAAVHLCSFSVGQCRQMYIVYIHTYHIYNIIKYIYIL